MTWVRLSHKLVLRPFSSGPTYILYGYHQFVVSGFLSGLQVVWPRVDKVMMYVHTLGTYFLVHLGVCRLIRIGRAHGYNVRWVGGTLTTDGNIPYLSMDLHVGSCPAEKRPAHSEEQGYPIGRQGGCGQESRSRQGFHSPNKDTHSCATCTTVKFPNRLVGAVAPSGSLTPSA